MNNTFEVYLPAEDQRFPVVVSGEDKPLVSVELIRKWCTSFEALRRLFDCTLVFAVAYSKDSRKLYADIPLNDPQVSMAGDMIAALEQYPQGKGLIIDCVIGKKQLMNIPDTNADPWLQNPFVKGLGLRSFIGLHLEWPDGDIYGALVAISREPHKFTEAQITVFRDYVKSMEAQLSKELYLHEMSGRAITPEDLHMREIHHRIKNHFTVLGQQIQFSAMSKLSSSGDGGRGTALTTLAKEIDAKLQAVATLHERIYRSDTLSVTLEEYIRDVAEITKRISPIPTEVRTNFHDHLPLEQRHLLELGMVVSEVLTNTIKYSNPLDGRLIFTISIRSMGNSEYEILFSDNGQGFKEQIVNDPNPRLGLGSMIVDSFANAFGGRCIRYNHPENQGAVIKLLIKP